MTSTSGKTYTALRSAHISDYERYFNRVSLLVKDTVPNNPQTSLPSDERLKKYATGLYDPQLEVLYFQYGRYLLISCSRLVGPPANLQGMWN